MSVRSEVAGVYDLIAGRVLADGGGRPSAGVQLHGGYTRAGGCEARLCGGLTQVESGYPTGYSLTVAGRE